MAPYSSTLAWKIPWTEEPGRLQSMGSLRVSRTQLSDFTFTKVSEIEQLFLKFKKSFIFPYLQTLSAL